MQYPRNSLFNQNALSNKNDFARLPPPHFTLRDKRNDTTAMKNFGFKQCTQTMHADNARRFLQPAVQQAVQLVAFRVLFGAPHLRGRPWFQPSPSTVVWGPAN